MSTLSLMAQGNMETTKQALQFLIEHACFNGMEKALMGDAIELLVKVEKYPLVYKVEMI